METGEVFLIMWATIATILAVVFKHYHEQAVLKQKFMEYAFLLVAEAKAEVYKEGDKIKVRVI